MGCVQLELVEDLVRRYAGTRSRDFPALRASGVVALDVVMDGARRHPNPSVRWRCIDLLDHLGGDECTETFVAALDDAVPRVRRHAVHALSCNRCKERPLCVDVAPVLERVARTDPNARVRAEAAEALARQVGRRPVSSTGGGPYGPRRKSRSARRRAGRCQKSVFRPPSAPRIVSQTARPK
jgi:hypothetical protein